MKNLNEQKPMAAWNSNEQKLRAAWNSLNILSDGLKDLLDRESCSADDAFSISIAMTRTKQDDPSQVEHLTFFAGHRMHGINSLNDLLSKLESE